MTAALLLTLALSAAEPTPLPTTPTPVIERIVTLPQQVRRVSLFDNRVAVVSIRENGVQVEVRRLTLDEHEFDIYLRAIQLDAETAGTEQADDIHGAESHGLLLVNVGPRAPWRLEYSTIAVADLSTGRLLSVVNDIEKRVLDASVSAESLRGWEPRVGDLVLTFSGQKARVSDIYDGGMIELEYEEVAIIEKVPAVNFDRVILEVLERAP
jgi:hypothetical protein